MAGTALSVPSEIGRQNTAKLRLRKACMQISISPLVDYECDVFQFQVLDAGHDVKRRILGAFESLLDLRSNRQICRCYPKDLPALLISERSNNVRVRFGWFCPRCIRELENLLSSIAVCSASVGVSPSCYVQPVSEYIRFESTEAEFEDGRVELLPPFAISKRCVSVSQFAAFAFLTGYKTSAEKQGDLDRFDCNASNKQFALKYRSELPAFCLSYVDAIEYCKWSKVRLPTEAELLSASLVDQKLMAQDELRCFFSSFAKIRESNYPNAI